MYVPLALDFAARETLIGPLSNDLARTEENCAKEWKQYPYRIFDTKTTDMNSVREWLKECGVPEEVFNNIIKDIQVTLTERLKKDIIGHCKAVMTEVKELDT